MREMIPMGKKFSFKKKMLIVLGTVFFITAAVLGSIKLYRIHLRDQSGILLAFDDYNEGTWRQAMELFDKYDVNVTFFINAYEPTDFCYDAIERGHEIAFHGAVHENMTDLSEQEVYDIAISPIEVFKENGIELTTFAYPGGAHNDALDEMLLPHYNILRGAWYKEIHPKCDLRHGFIEAMPIDNYYYPTQESFETAIDSVLNEVSQTKGVVVCLYSHSVDDGGDWCIAWDKLEYLLKKAQEMNLQFYTFKELEEN